MVLIPIPQHPFDVQWHAQVQEFLDEKKIRSVDLTRSFIERGEHSDSLFLRDGHLSRRGNAVVAEVLEQEFGELIARRLAEAPAL